MFEWDARKAVSNETKHGVSFREAATVFDDPDRLEASDPAHSVAEPRTRCVGLSLRGRVLMVAFTYRETTDGQASRLISARPANRRERATYDRAVPPDRR